MERADLERVARALSIYGPEYRHVEAHDSIGLVYAHACFVPEAIDEEQPVLGGGGRFVLLFDGRLDNREELAGDLRISEPELRLLPDSAIVMRAWERWATSLPERLLGDFALIVWDKVEQRLFAARDHFGFQTLSYHVDDDCIVVASTPKAIIASGVVSLKVDHQKLADILVDSHHDSERCLYEGISRLPPAHTLSVDRRSVSLRRYWTLEYRDREIRLRTDQDYVDAGRELLEKSVKARLRSSGTVGCELSGGLDSSAIAVSALSLLDRQNKLPIFTCVPEPGWKGKVARGRYADEQPYVQSIVDMHPRLDPTWLPGAGLGFDHGMNDVFANSHTIAWSVMGSVQANDLFRAARDRGVKVLLNGHPGNDSLSWSGYGAYVDWFKQGRLLHLYRELRAVTAGPTELARRFMGRVVLPMGPDWLWNLSRRLRFGRQKGPPWEPYSLINPDFARQMSVEARAADLGYNFYGRVPTDTRELRARCLTTDLAHETAHHRQGACAMYGIDFRSPLHDRRLVEWCLRIPEEQYLRNGQPRWLIKRIMAGRLPAPVLQAKARGQNLPDWHQRMTRDLPSIREQLDVLATDADVAALLDIPRIRKLLDNWPKETPIDPLDPMRWLLPRVLPHALATGRFVRWTKGANL